MPSRSVTDTVRSCPEEKNGWGVCSVSDTVHSTLTKIVPRSFPPKRLVYLTSGDLGP